ncbi:hypothetical protein UT300007_14220 [Clostridium sp. CTA-7]
MRRVLIFSLLIFSRLFYGCNKEEIKKLPMEESVKKVYEQYNADKKYEIGDKVEVKGKIEDIKNNNNYIYFYKIENSIYGYNVIVQLESNIISEDAKVGDYITLNCMIDSFNNSTFPDAEAIVYYESISNDNSDTKKTMDLDTYIKFRAGLETKIGIGESEAQILDRHCKSNEEIMIFEKALKDNIYKMYPKIK